MVPPIMVLVMVPPIMFLVMVPPIILPIVFFVTIFFIAQTKETDVLQKCKGKGKWMSNNQFEETMEKETNNRVERGTHPDATWLQK